MRYSVVGYQRYTCYDKCYFSVEADSPEEALFLVKEEPSDYFMVSVCMDTEDYEWLDEDDWEVQGES